MITESYRGLFVELANELLPGNDRQPAASELGLAQTPLDRLLVSRPDMESGLETVLDQYLVVRTQGATAFIASLSEGTFRQLLTAVCGCYFLLPKVRESLGYDGQQARGLGRGGFGAEELVIEQMQRPKCYREA